MIPRLQATWAKRCTTRSRHDALTRCALTRSRFLYVWWPTSDRRLVRTEPMTSTWSTRWPSPGHRASQRRNSDREVHVVRLWRTAARGSTQHATDAPTRTCSGSRYVETSFDTAHTRRGNVGFAGNLWQLAGPTRNVPTRCPKRPHSSTCMCVRTTACCRHLRRLDHS